MCAPVLAEQQLSVEVPQMVPACSLWQNEKQAMTPTIQLREHFYCCAPTFLDFSARILSRVPSSAACGKLIKRSFETSTQESVHSSLCSTSSTLLLWFCSDLMIWGLQIQHHRPQINMHHALNCGHKGTVEGIVIELPGFRLLGYAAHQYLAKTRLTRWSDKEFATDLCEFCPESNPVMMCNMSILNFTFNGYADLLQKFRRTKPTKQSMCAPVSAGQQLSVEVPQMVPACSLWQNEKQAMTSTIQLREHFYCCAPTFLDFSARILSRVPSSAACGKLFKRSFETSTQESAHSSLCSTSSTLLLWFCSDLMIWGLQIQHHKPYIDKHASCFELWSQRNCRRHFDRVTRLPSVGLCCATSTCQWQSATNVWQGICNRSLWFLPWIKSSHDVQNVNLELHIQWLSRSASEIQENKAEQTKYVCACVSRAAAFCRSSADGSCM